MKSGYLFVVISICTMILGGCGTANVIKANVPASNTPMVSGSTPKDLSPKITGKLTKNDLKIGQLYIDQPLTNIQSIFGIPSVETIVHGNSSPQLEYHKQGFTVGGSPVFFIMVLGGFSGSTSRGIHIGSTEAEAQKAYPAARMVQNNTQLLVESTDQKYSITFLLTQGKVSQIVLRNEMP